MLLGVALLRGGRDRGDLVSNAGFHEKCPTCRTVKMPATDDASLARLVQLMSSNRDGLERCFAALERLSVRIGQIERILTVSNTRAERVDAKFDKAIELERLDAIDSAGVAALLRCTREHATNRVTKMAGFPKPVINLSQKTRAWDRDEVLAFVNKRPRRHR